MMTRDGWEIPDCKQIIKTLYKCNHIDLKRISENTGISLGMLQGILSGNNVGVVNERKLANFYYRVMIGPVSKH